MSINLFTIAVMLYVALALYFLVTIDIMNLVSGATGLRAFEAGSHIVLIGIPMLAGLKYLLARPF